MYTSDLSDAEWDIIKHHIPEAIWFPNLQEPKYSRREILNGILYREKTGVQWRNLPCNFPPWKQVHEYYRKWRDGGIFERLHDHLRSKVREQIPHRDATLREEPTLAILDSQSVKTSEEAAKNSGFDAGKKVKGRKRHLVVDALGLLINVQVTSASVQDRDAALSILLKAKREFPSLNVVLMDGGYRGEIKRKIEESAKLRVEIKLRSDKKKVFEPLPIRWIVERTFGWLNRFRLLSKEFERTIASSVCDIYLCMSRLMLRRLAV